MAISIENRKFFNPACILCPRWRFDYIKSSCAKSNTVAANRGPKKTRSDVADPSFGRGRGWSPDNISPTWVSWSLFVKRYKQMRISERKICSHWSLLAFQGHSGSLSTLTHVGDVSWRHSIVVRTLVSAGELSLSCARLLAGWVTTLWLSRPLSVSQHGQLSHPSLRGRYMSSNPCN